MHIDEKLILSNDSLIASGKNRECHLHPNFNDVCIKIPTEVKGYKDSLKEVTYLKNVEKRLDYNFDYYSKFLYTVKTNKGPGWAYELIRDKNTDNVSRTLEDVYLDSLFLNKGVEKERLDSEILNLVKRLQTDKILITDFNTKNVLVQFENEHDFKLKLVDGLGRRNNIPFLDRFGWVSQKKVKSYYMRKLRIIIASYNDAFDYLRKSK